jgi:hypothetical protein
MLKLIYEHFGWAGYVARMRLIRMHIGIRRESPQERGFYECQEVLVGGWILINWILEGECGIVWAGLI